jgi:hypothetical protein
VKQRLAPFLVLLEARYAPLLFAVAPQAYAVYLWLWRGSDRADASFWFAIAGALGYELVYVGAIAWAEEGRSSFWTWATAGVALIFSVVVAFYVYRAQGEWAWLHAGFPLVAFCYTLNMYSKRSPSAQAATAQEPLAALQERSRSAEAPESVSAAPPPRPLDRERFLDELLELPLATAQNGQALVSAALEPSADGLAVTSAPLEPTALSAYACDYCQAPLKNKQAVGAMRTNKYCPNCKHERKAA